jgi:hypothetical protein
MGPLDPLLIYMVFGLPNSAEKLIHRSSFGPVERGAEAVRERANRQRHCKNRQVIGRGSR